MSDFTLTNRAALIEKIDSAWDELNTFIAGLTDRQFNDLVDQGGWSVKDHLTHIAAWEESIAMLFHGKQRHETLGIEPYDRNKIKNFDAINAIIRDHWLKFNGTSAMREYQRIHTMLMDSVRTLSQTDLDLPAMDYFSQPLYNDDRRLSLLIRANTADHVLEHLPWMKAIASGNS